MDWIGDGIILAFAVIAIAIFVILRGISFRIDDGPESYAPKDELPPLAIHRNVKEKPTAETPVTIEPIPSTINRSLIDSSVSQPGTSKSRMWKLNEGESIITEASFGISKGGVYITNHRVVYDEKTFWDTMSKTRTISLEQIDSVDVITLKFSPFWLIFPALGLIGGIIGVSENADILAFFGFTVAFVLTIIYFSGRKKQITIRSGNSQTSIGVAPLSYKSIQSLVFAIESAKQDRFDRVEHGKQPVLTNPTIQDRLQEAEKLYHKGLINMDEWNDKRRDILGDL